MTPISLKVGIDALHEMRYASVWVCYFDQLMRDRTVSLVTSELEIAPIHSVVETLAKLHCHAGRSRNAWWGHCTNQRGAIKDGDAVVLCECNKAA